MAAAGPVAAIDQARGDIGLKAIDEPARLQVDADLAAGEKTVALVARGEASLRPPVGVGPAITAVRAEIEAGPRVGEGLGHRRDRLGSGDPAAPGPVAEVGGCGTLREQRCEGSDEKG